MFSFKQSSAEELKHDRLWRTTRCPPERGRIGPSATEEIYKIYIYAESVQGAEHLRRILEEPQTIVGQTLAVRSDKNSVVAS